MSEPEVVNSELSKEETSLKTTKTYMWWSMGLGLIPFPLLDIAAISGLQIKMLHAISKIYDVPFKESLGKSIIASLLGTLTANGLSYGLVGSILKAIPGLGMAFGVLSMPLFAGAATYAIGKVFIQHYETGGTLLDLNPEKVKNYFAEQFAEGKKVAGDLKNAKK